MRRAVLVGRQAEQSVLAEAVEAARQGRGSSVFLMGEAGIGKSRLAAEVTDPAAAAGMRVLRGRAASVGAAVPFRPLSEALHSVLRQGPPQDAALGQYWPVLAGFDPGLPGYAAAPAKQSLVLRAEALLRMLCALGRSAGSILLLEDLHDADAETLAVIDYLADNLAGNLAAAPVLLLATLRPDPGPGAELVEAATARRVATVLRLGRLSPEQTVELAAGQLGTAVSRVPAKVVTRLHRDADGVPFVVEELLSAMVDSGHLVRRRTGWGVDEAVATDVPATVTAAIRQRVQRLDDRCVALLEAAAVLGRRFATPLAAAIAGVPAGEEFALLREAADSGFIVPDPGGCPNWYAFRHALTGEAILHRLLPGERAALSRRAAEAVEAGSAHVGDDWPQLAAELWLAGGEPRRAAVFFARAGRRATDRGALATAVELLELALALLDTAAGLPTIAMADVLDDLVYALTLTGDTPRALAFGERLVSVLATVDASAERRGQAHLARARAAAIGSQWELGLAEVEAAWRLVGADAGPRIAAPLDAVAARLVLSGRQSDRLAVAMKLAHRALTAAEPFAAAARADAPAVLPEADGLREDAASWRLPAVACEALEVLGRCTRQHDFAVAERYFTHALQIAERHALTVWRIRALMELGVIDKLRYSGFERLEEARQAALDAGAVVTACWADLQLSTAHLVRGEYAQAMLCADRVSEAAARLRLPELRAFATGSKAGIYALQARRAELDRTLTECESDGSRFGYGMEVRACAGGTCALLSEEHEEALAEFAKAGDEDLAVATLRASGYRGPYLLLRAVYGHAGQAEYEAFADSQFANVNWNQPFLAATNAVLLGRAGRHAEATAAMEEAFRTGTALPVALGLVRRLTAEAALTDGWGDPVGWLRGAEDFFHQQELPRVAAACRALLRRAGATPRQRRAGSQAIPDELRRAGVTVREHEVLMLLADRLGNQAIAERLFLSPRTVEKHVSSLLTRTQQADRAALVSLARRHASRRSRWAEPPLLRVAAARYRRAGSPAAGIAHPVVPRQGERMRHRFSRRTSSLAAAALLAAVGAAPVVADRHDAARPRPRPPPRQPRPACPSSWTRCWPTRGSPAPRLAWWCGTPTPARSSTPATAASGSRPPRTRSCSPRPPRWTPSAWTTSSGPPCPRAGTRAGTVLTGNLYLKGTGDPTLNAAGFDALAAQVVAAGIKAVRGTVIADDSWFDADRIGAEWASSDEQFSYAAQISALTVAANDVLDTGIVQVGVKPAAAAGSAPTVTLTPATNYVKIVNNATTGAAGSGISLAVNRVHGNNTLVITGSVPAAGATETRLRAVEEPTGYATAMLRAALIKRGVTITATTTPRATTPAGATQVAVRDSITLSQLLPFFLKLSNSGHAEILTKAMGRKVSNQGTWSAGLAVSTTFLRDNGVDTANLRLSDGSGLSRLDLVTPDQMTVLLKAVQNKPWFATWLAALPVAGNPDRLVGGTLANRLGGTAAANNLRGKTGSMTSVSALSGYVTDAGGQKLVFSMFSNDWVASSVKAIEDSVAVTLANSGAPAATLKKDLARIPKQRARTNDPTTEIDERTLECSWVKAC